MKQKDLTSILMAVVLSITFSFFVTARIFGSKVGKLKVETVESITTDFPIPDEKYFNDQSLNPTKQINIGPNKNDNPFSGSQ